MRNAYVRRLSTEFPDWLSPSSTLWRRHIGNPARRASQQRANDATLGRLEEAARGVRHCATPDRIVANTSHDSHPYSQAVGSERNRLMFRTAVVLLLALSMVVGMTAGADPRLAMAVLVIGLVGGGWFMARQFRTQPHTPWEQASKLVSTDRAVVLWKPGCLYCERLLRELRTDPMVIWVNVWADPDANRVVRGLNDGNELTPTAVIGNRVLVNPSADALLAALPGT